MEPDDDPPSSPDSGQGSHDPAQCAEHEHFHGNRNSSGKRLASSLFFPPTSTFPVKHAKRAWWSKGTVALVTGGNKGLGLEIVRQFAKEGLTVVLTARDPEKGQSALNTLKDEEGLESVCFHQLDVTSSASVEDLADWLQKEFGGLDILVNNAGVHFYSESHEDAVETLETNYYGLKRITNALLPLMRESWAGARIVNVSSQAASLQRFSSCLQTKISNVDSLSEEMLDNLATEYLEEVKAGCFLKAKKVILNNFQFCESKLLLNTYTQILARSLAFKQPQYHKIFLNAMCPGTVQTDMAAFVIRGPKEAGQDVLNDIFRGCTIQSVENGAVTAVWLALLPRPSYPNGRFFSNKKQIAF